MPNSVSVDWLQGSFPVDRLDEVLRFVSVLIKDSSDYEEWGRYMYDRHYSFARTGACIYFDSSKDRCLEIHNGRCSLALPSTALRHLPDSEIFRALRALYWDFHFVCTRVDLAFDDYEFRVEPADVFEAAKVGNLTGFRKSDYIERVKVGGELLGSTCYLGTRGAEGSGKYLRIYNKNLESNGEFNCIRWELELTQKRSFEVFGILARSENIEQMIVSIGSLVAGCVSFIDRSSGARASRCEVLDWWRQIVDLLGGVLWFRLPVEDTTIERAKEHIKVSLVPTLRMLNCIYPKHELSEMLFDWCGQGCLSRKHRRVLDNLVERVGYEFSRVAVRTGRDSFQLSEGAGADE